LHAPAVPGDVDQVRGAGEVVVPEAVVDELVMPDAAAGLCFQADERLAEEVRAGAVAAVPVVVGRAAGEADVVELGVVAHDRPDLAPAGVLPGAALPGVVAELALLGDGVEAPELPAGARVETAHVAGRHLLLVAEVVDGAAADDHFAADDRRRGVRD